MHYLRWTLRGLGLVSEVFLRYVAFNELEGVGAYRQGTISICHWLRLIIRDNNILLKGVGMTFLTVSEI